MDDGKHVMLQLQEPTTSKNLFLKMFVNVASHSEQYLGFTLCGLSPQDGLSWIGACDVLVCRCAVFRERSHHCQVLGCRGLAFPGREWFGRSPRQCPMSKDLVVPFTNYAELVMAMRHESQVGRILQSDRAPIARKELGMNLNGGDSLGNTSADGNRNLVTFHLDCSGTLCANRVSSKHCSKTV